MNYLDEQISNNGYESESSSSSSKIDEDLARSALEIEADAFTRFIERQRVEVMFELRHLRLGERPVTGQSNRERIASFLTQIQEQQQHQNMRAPAVRPAMPSAHIDDIDSLVNRRCVSAALGSMAFRQDLENVIRRSIGTRTVPSRQSIPRAPPMPQSFTPINIEQQHSQNLPDSPTTLAPIESTINEQRRPDINQNLTHEPFNIERYSISLTCLLINGIIFSIIDRNVSYKHGKL